LKEGGDVGCKGGGFRKGLSFELNDRGLRGGEELIVVFGIGVWLGVATK
jgi:hypothetical protein